MQNIPTEFSLTINGTAHPGTEHFAVINPATGQPFAQAPDCTRAQLDQAVTAARQAFPAWAAQSMEERGTQLRQVAAKIAEHAAEIGHLLTMEQGKSLADATQEVEIAAYWLGESTNQTLPEDRQTDPDGRDIIVRHLPIGVVAAIVPWNYPISLAMMKLGPALLSGCTVIWKPAPTTPLASLRTGELIRDLLPPGVLNVIAGSDRLGPWLSAHPGIDKISFTGSTAVGKQVMKSAADTLKRLTLELGGNDPAIVLPDVDIQQVAEKLFWAAFVNAGQICIAAKRIYIHESIYDELRDALVAYARNIKVGDGLAEDTVIGPLQNQRQYQRVRDLLESCQQSGHRFALGGKAPDGPGYFIPLSIVDNPPEDSKIVQEEQFGPIVPLLKFSEVEDAIARANDSQYGLGASVWSADRQKAQQIATQLQSGMVWINEAHYATPHTPFGGHKQSGLGVENGTEGLREFMLTQTLYVPA
ncbi:MAG: aldehyde dehydrogenase family protein [Cellvibrionales bacterium]|nr:aldehyde dehydrogenase family protein [Cellvibrionales bacterium]